MSEIDKEIKKEDIEETTEETIECEAETAEEKAESTAAQDAEAAGEDESSKEAETVESSEAEDSETSDKSGDDKKSFFKKKDKKDKKDEKIDDLTDKLKRSMAEFENFRKRTEKEKSHMYEIGASDVISKILPVVDNFERGLDAVTEDKKDDPIVSGMELIYKQLMTALTDIGVTPIEAVGREFDPNIHNAVMHVEDEELGDNIVAEEFQKGYRYRNSIIRHSMVKVAN